MIEFLEAGKRRMLLQIFAEGGDSGSGGPGGEGGGAPGGGDGGSGGKEGGSGSEPLSFEAFLKQEGNQAEFERRVKAAVDAAVSGVEEKWKALTDDKLSEAEKLAKMTEKERAEYEKKKLQDELDALKHEKEVAGLATEARKTLSEDGINIPDELLANLIGKDAAKTKANVEAFTKLFNDAVNEVVKKKAQQDTPPEGGGQGFGSGSKMNLAEMAAKARIIK